MAREAGGLEFVVRDVGHRRVRGVSPAPAVELVPRYLGHSHRVGHLLLPPRVVARRDNGLFEESTRRRCPQRPV